MQILFTTLIYNWSVQLLIQTLFYVSVSLWSQFYYEAALDWAMAWHSIEDKLFSRRFLTMAADNYDMA